MKRFYGVGALRKESVVPGRVLTWITCPRSGCSYSFSDCPPLVFRILLRCSVSQGLQFKKI